MGIKKAVLLGGMALAIMALAVPAMAGTEEEMYDAVTEEQIGAHVEFDMKGTESYLFFGSGFDCKVELVYTTEGKKNNRIKSYKVKDCKGTGIFKDCVVKSTESTDLPWSVDLAGGDIIVKDKTIDLNLEKCGSTFFKIYFKAEKMTPDKLKGFGLMTATQEEETTEYGESESEQTSSAEFEVEGEDKGTYGIK